MTRNHTNLARRCARAGHPDENFGLTQNSQKTQNFSINADINANLDSNSQNARIASLACGLPDGTVPSLRGTSEAEGVSLNDERETWNGAAELRLTSAEGAINQRPKGVINRNQRLL